MTQLVWTLRARADIQDHYDYLLKVDEEAAQKAIRAIVEAGRQLATTSKIGVLLDKPSGLRKWPVKFGKAGYVLHYIPMDSKIVIERVYHGSQSRPY